MTTPTELENLLKDGRVYIPEGGGVPKLKRYAAPMSVKSCETASSPNSAKSNPGAAALPTSWEKVGNERSVHLAVLLDP